MKKTIFFTLLYLFVTSLPSYSQKSVKVRFEEIKEKCKGLEQGKKIKIAVARFNITTPNCGGEFGANMATMLTNALQQTECYTVLAQLKNLNDLKGEIAFNKSDDASGENGPESGKMMAAQLVISGEITEYSVKESGASVGIFKGGSYSVKIGFILQIINPETRELISKSINVEARMGGGIGAGVFVPYIGNLNLAGASKKDIAIANTLEKGILEAVEYMSQDQDKIKALAPGANNADKNNTTVVTLLNSDFTFLTLFTDSIKTLAQVLEIQKSLKDGVATARIRHKATTDDLVSEINKLFKNKVEVIDFAEGKVTLNKINN